MLAQAGVTTALDMSGPVDSVLDIARDYGVGLIIAVPEHVRQGHTVANADPGVRELQDLLHKCLRRGALGWKLLGGHYPLTPEATAAAIRLATAKRESGEFAVGCISTDGGGIPRNVIVEMGLALVKLQALSLQDFVQKTSVNPARVLGLRSKGHFRPGADADITVLDLDRQLACMSIATAK